MEITYDRIKPILLDSRVEEGKIFCQFKCKNSDDVVNSSAVIRQEQNTKTKVINIVKDSLINEVKRTITNQLIKLVGGRIASTASSVASTAIDGSRKAIRFTPGEKKDAIVDAFRFVANQFHYDEHSMEWGMMEGLSNFQQYIIHHPIEGEYDRQILAKLLVEAASIEDELSLEEEEFIQSLMPEKNVLHYDINFSEGASQVELQEVSPGSAKSLFLMTAVVLLLNRKFSEAEKQKLSGISVGLNILEAEANALIRIAQEYIIENAIISTTLDKAKLFELADNIQISHEEAERIVIQYSRRVRQ